MKNRYFLSVLELLFVVINLQAGVSSQNIVLENNGYKGVLIAISENVGYDSELVPRIKVR